MRTSTRSGGRQRKRASVPDCQLPLPLFEHGLQAAHQHPLVADETKVIKGRRPAPEAWKNWAYIESNPPHAYAAMLFDIDDPDRWEYEVSGPVPNWQVRKDSQPATYHVAYALEIPVARHDAAHMKPLRFFRDIYDGLAVRISADHRYSGLITKNPLNPPPGCSTQWFRFEPYTLSELREWLPLEIPKLIHTTGVGRGDFATQGFNVWQHNTVVLPTNIAKHTRCQPRTGSRYHPQRQRVLQPLDLPRRCALGLLILGPRCILRQAREETQK